MPKPRISKQTRVTRTVSEKPREQGQGQAGVGSTILVLSQLDSGVRAYATNS
jgi:hypothetical protein